MKKIMILIFVLGIVIVYSCKKENKEVSTTISGQLRTNGTEDPIKMSNELPKPVVILYERIDQVGYTGSGYKVFAKTTVDDKGRFSFKEDLKNKELYFLGVEDLDTSIYWQIDHYTWWNMAYNGDINVMKPGQDNYRNLYISSKAWIRPRFINTNTNQSNNDIFEYRGGDFTYIDVIVDSNSVPNGSIIFHGMVDTLLGTIHKTWGGKYATGYDDGLLIRTHHVRGKLTRNGITRDTVIYFTVPPFDTTTIQIRY